MLMYVDDLGLSCQADMDVLFEIATDVAAMLGLVFKPSKDVCSASQMKFVGFWIDTAGDAVSVGADPEYCQQLAGQIRQLLTIDEVELGTLE